MRILIADDDWAVRSALRFLFDQEAELCVVAEAEDASGLLRLAASVQPDVVLLDWELPCAGDSVLPRLRAACPCARVVALSGRLQSGQSPLSAGADAFVSKSDPPEQVLATVLRAGNGHGRDLARCPAPPPDQSGHSPTDQPRTSPPG